MKKAHGARKLSLGVSVTWLTLGFLWLAGVFVLQAQEDQSLPFRPLEGELKRKQLDEFKGWSEEDFARLDVNDPQLKRAYLDLFGTVAGLVIHPSEAHMQAALADLKKRGNLVTPMFLEVMRENPETRYELLILLHVPKIEGLDLKLYLDYSRQVLRKRSMTMNDTLASASSMLIASQGDVSDRELLEWVIETRPFVAYSVSKQLDVLNQHIPLKEETGASLPNRDPITDSATATERKGPSGEPAHESANPKAVNERTNFVKWPTALGLLTAVLAIAAAVVLWLRRGKARI
ncbi:hypothetical protein OKA05_15990 [Luteolibacter arcticus]|uniref:Uncharacterized protein n=1 Tax=Luteolibacter arcticus TaxID=1581411 RepID=A0ABT3GKM0_9BACT|nr:hypothetical protein [Luteolibacter arcticus]MCW1924069.1 hypothetical protein [Luteolibacter arcticus]